MEQGKVAVAMQTQDSGALLHPEASDGFLSTSGPTELLYYGLFNLFERYGFHDIRVYSSYGHSSNPTPGRVEALGARIKQKLKLKLPEWDAVGFPFNTRQDLNEFQIRDLSTHIYRADDEELRLWTPGMKLRPKNTPMHEAINNFATLQLPQTSDYVKCLEAINEGRFIVHLSATHDGDIAPVAAIAHYLHLAGHDLGEIVFDAHGDYNSYKTSPSRNLHGMHNTIATLRHMSKNYFARLGSTHPDLPERKIHPENLLIVGGRAFDPLEERLIQYDGVNLFPMSQIADAKKQGKLAETFEERLEKAMEGVDGVIVSIDFDVLDELALLDWNYSVYTPVSNGLAPKDLEIMLEVVAKSKKPVYGLLVSELKPSVKFGKMIGVYEKSYDLGVGIIRGFLANISATR